MNRFEEYLNSLDRKNLFFLYASVIIVVFIIYYNYNYSFLQEKIETNNQEISELQTKLKKSTRLKKKLVYLKSELKTLKKKNLSLNEDLKYLNILIKTSSVLHINEKGFLNILKNVLQEAVNNNIQASYTIDKETDEYKKYLINIKGSFEPESFEKFYEFVKNLENIKFIKEISHLKLNKKEKIEFDMTVVFWSLL